jgi:hypothetical protein
VTVTNIRLVLAAKPLIGGEGELKYFFIVNNFILLFYFYATSPTCTRVKIFNPAHLFLFSPRKEEKWETGYFSSKNLGSGFLDELTN